MRMHTEIFARFAVFRKRAHQRILETLRRAGEKHEVQQYIKMEDDENDRRKNIESQKQQGYVGDVEDRQFERAFQE
jgi:hypothetical protein